MSRRSGRHARIARARASANRRDAAGSRPSATNREADAAFALLLEQQAEAQAERRERAARIDAERIEARVRAKMRPVKTEDGVDQAAGS